MMRFGGRFLAALLAVLLVPAPGSAQDHVVSAGDVHARLAASATERAANRGAVESALAAPAAAQAAKVLHADLDRIRSGAASLTDAELRDVAARAQLLTMDPVAGTHPVIWILAGLGVLLVLMILLLIGSCADGGGACNYD